MSCLIYGQQSRGSAFLEKARTLQLSAPDSSILFAQLAFSEGLKIADYWVMAKSKAISARSKTSKGNDIDAFFDYLAAIEFLSIADTVDAFLAYTVNKNLAVIQHDYGLFEEAVSYYDSAKKHLKIHLELHPKIALRYRDHLLIHRLNLFKAVNEFKADNLDQAQDLLLRIIADPDVETSIKFSAKNRLGSMLAESGDEDGAISIFSELINSSGASETIRGRALHNIAASYFRKTEFEKAIKFYRQAIKVKKTSSNPDPNSLFLSYMDLGETYLNMGDNPSAVEFLEKGLTVNIPFEDDPSKYRLLQLLGRANIPVDHELAIHYLELFDKVDNKYKEGRGVLGLENKRRKFVTAVTNYKQMKSQEQLMENEASSNARRLIWLLVGSIFLTFLALFLVKKLEQLRRRRFYKKLVDTGLD